MNNHKEVCLSIDGPQPVKFEKETIEFKHYFKQIPVPFKFYANFECNLDSVESYEGSCSKKNIKITFLVVLLTNLFVLMINLVSQLLFREAKMLLLNSLKQCFKNMSTVKSNENIFYKNLIMTEEEEQFQSSNTCWIC